MKNNYKKNSESGKYKKKYNSIFTPKFKMI